MTSLKKYLFAYTSLSFWTTQYAIEYFLAVIFGEKRRSNVVLPMTREQHNLRFLHEKY